MSQDFIRLVKEYKLGNVILFQRNIESMTQVKKLCADIQRLVKKETGHCAFIAIDQEGGTVTRLSKDACNVPGAMAVATTGNPKNAEVLAEITANELKYLGINFNLAPVMDVNNNPNNPIIGVRSYGDTAETVKKYGVAALQGYQKEKGFQAVYKAIEDKELSLEEMQETFVEYMIKMFEGRGFATSKNPDQEEIKKVIEMAGESTSVIIGTNNGHLQSGQKALIKALSGADIPVMVIAMGNPYDLEGLSKNVTGIAAWDNSLMTLELLVEMLQGKWVPEGKLPIHLN